MATTSAVENLDWTFEQLSRLEKIERLVNEALEVISAPSGSRRAFPQGSDINMTWLRLLNAKGFIDADLATVPASMRPEVTA